MAQLLEPAVRDWDFPRHVRGIAVLVDYAAAHGLAPRTVLAGSGLRVTDLDDDELEVTAAQELRVVRNVLRLGSRSARSGVVLGRRYRVETFGIIGYALLASRTLMDAVNVALRFMDLTFAFSIPHARVEGDTVVIEAYADTLPSDVRDFLVARDLSAVEAVLRELFLGSLPTAYDAARSQVTLPASYLEAALPRAYPAGQALAEELCADLAGRRRDRSALVQQVRVLLTQRLSFDPSAGGVAAALGMSERTLRRRLAAEGIGFQRVLDQVRATLAAKLLATGSLSVDEVAGRLGYAESASFIHAHRRWLGTTPGQAARAAPGG